MRNDGVFRPKDRESTFSQLTTLRINMSSRSLCPIISSTLLGLRTSSTFDLNHWNPHWIPVFSVLYMSSHYSLYVMSN